MTALTTTVLTNRQKEDLKSNWQVTEIEHLDDKLLELWNKNYLTLAEIQDNIIEPLFNLLKTRKYSIVIVEDFNLVKVFQLVQIAKYLGIECLFPTQTNFISYY